MYMCSGLELTSFDNDLIHDFGAYVLLQRSHFAS